MILQTENLTIVRNQQAVIYDLNFTLADTEKVVLQGEIGSGKSSFLLALLGFVPLASGSLYWLLRARITWSVMSNLLFT